MIPNIGMFSDTGELGPAVSAALRKPRRAPLPRRPGCK